MRLAAGLAIISDSDRSIRFDEPAAGALLHGACNRLMNRRSCHGQ